MSQIKVLPQNLSMTGLSLMKHDVQFACPEGIPLYCTILRPWNEKPEKPYPAIVFLQGSAWTFPDRYYELPQLAWYANHGYVIMTITHRNCNEGHPYPAYLQDAKTAIRYLRANAQEYHVDTNRIAFWGTSSGGNTSMLVQLTGDDASLKTEEYAEFSDSVKCSIECFGPSDLVKMISQFRKQIEEAKDGNNLFLKLKGNQDMQSVAEGMSPYYRVQAGKNYPPILMLHGSGDPVVDYETQGVRMYEKYKECGVEASMICIEGAPHEGPFWSQAVHDEVLAFLKEKL